MSYNKNAKNDILEVAVLLFSDKEYSKVTVTEIARLANVPTSLIYYYFSSKQDLLISSYIQLISTKCNVIKKLTFKRLTLLLMRTFYERPKYACSVAKILNKNDVKSELRSISFDLLSICDDVPPHQMDSYHVILVSLLAHPSIMKSNGETNVNVNDLISVLSQLMK